MKNLILKNQGPHPADNQEELDDLLNEGMFAEGREIWYHFNTAFHPKEKELSYKKFTHLNSGEKKKMKYRLTEDFAGKKKGDILEVVQDKFTKLFSAFEVTYKGAKVLIPFQSELLQEIKPLYTTYDGVEVFEGDTVYVIGGNGKKLKDDLNWSIREVKVVGTGQLHEGSYFVKNSGLSSADCSYEDNGGDPVLLKFSNKSNAEKYILFNKPVITLQSILDNFKDLTEEEEEDLILFAQSIIFPNETNQE